MADKAEDRELPETQEVQPADGEQQGQTEPSLREQLESAFDEHAEAEAGDEAGGVEGKADRAGKIGKAEEADAQRGQQAQQQNADSRSAPEIPPPASWKAEAKAQWAKLPAEVRKYINEREAEVQRGFTRFDEDRNLGKSMRDVLAPHQETLRRLGVPPQQAVANLISAESILRAGTPEQKMNMMHVIARDYGIPLDAVMQHRPNLVDPAFAQLQQRVQQFEQLEQQRQQTQEHQQLAQAHAEVDTFRAKNPHFESVRADMHDLIVSGLASSLQDAYDRAVWAKPDLREALISEREAQARKTAEQANRTASARRAGASIAGMPGTGKAAAVAPARSLREELAANMRAATGRI